MDFFKDIKQSVVEGIKSIYDIDFDIDKVNFVPTRTEFEGDYTFVVFPLVRQAKSKPEEIASSIGAYLVEHGTDVQAFGVVKGFLNISLKQKYWHRQLQFIYSNGDYGVFPKRGEKVLVEFSSPNTNKPLHLGHVRNILLGWSCSRMLEDCGYDVIKAQIVNDRGIAICKSMLAWKKFGNGDTPKSTGIKGDFFVGKYYVLFEQKFKKEYALWQETPAAASIFTEKSKDGQDKLGFFKKFKNEYFNTFSELGKEAKRMLLAWEDGDTEVVSLWKKMNDWVYAGFDQTYKAMGVHFDHLYYESNTYLLGKDHVAKGLADDVFYKKEDGSVWIDLEEEKLDHKLVLRSDGTSVYMTQDIGTAEKRYEDHKVERMVYVVADEQDYHFKALFAILKKLGASYAAGLHHLSYGMVDLPTGKMKSREGTVVDADDLMEEVIREAQKNAEERGELDTLDSESKKDLYRKIGLGALKFFILKVNAKKRMVFNPAESVDMQGQTGPYIQNANVRIQSVLRKYGAFEYQDTQGYDSMVPQEITLIQQLMAYPNVLLEGARSYDPSGVANYAYELAKSFHKFYHDVRILKAETETAKAFRLLLCINVAKVLEKSMNVLGIEMPEKM